MCDVLLLPLQWATESCTRDSAANRCCWFVEKTFFSDWRRTAACQAYPSSGGKPWTSRVSLLIFYWYSEFSSGVHTCSQCVSACFFFLLGQVRQMHQEEEEEGDGAKLTHIRIPAAYSSGVTFFALRESELGQELLSAPELPCLWRDWHSWTRLIYYNIFFKNACMNDSRINYVSNTQRGDEKATFSQPHLICSPPPPDS